MGNRRHDDVRRSPSFHRARFEADRNRRAVRPHRDHSHDRKRRRSTGTASARRPADRVGSARDGHRASGSLPRLASGSAERMRAALEYVLVRSLLVIVRIAPHGLGRAMGSTLGFMFYVLDRTHRRVAERNLETAFPARSRDERTAIARAAFGHFGRLLFELLKFSTLTDEEMLARVDVDGEEHSRLAYAQ